MNNRHHSPRPRPANPRRAAALREKLPEVTRDEALTIAQLILNSGLDLHDLTPDRRDYYAACARQIEELKWELRSKKTQATTTADADS